MVEFNGLGYLVVIYIKDVDLVCEFGIRICVICVIWNFFFIFGGIGDVYNVFLLLLIFGCGLYGCNLVGDNVSVINFLNIKKVGRCRNNM